MQVFESFVAVVFVVVVVDDFQKLNFRLNILVKIVINFP